MDDVVEAMSSLSTSCGGASRWLGAGSEAESEVRSTGSTSLEPTSGSAVAFVGGE